MTSFELGKALDGLRGRGPAVVLMHDNPDPDCMAAAECLRALLGQELGAEVTVARGGIIGRAENRAMVQVLGLEHTPIEGLDLGKFGIVALVDTQPETGNNSLPVGHKVDIVVDHHPPREGAARAAWCDIREDFGASSTIAWTYLRDRQVPVDARLATALMYAIKTETNDLLRDASEHEQEAYASLLKIADLDRLQLIAAPKVPAAHFSALDRALRAAAVRGSLVTVNLGELDYPDLVAEIADLLLPFDQARWVLSVGRWHGSVFLSIRTDVTDAHAGSLVRRVVGTRGAAGGHGQIAGGRLHAPATTHAELVRQYAFLVSALATELGIHDPPRPLLEAPTRGRPKGIEF